MRTNAHTNTTTYKQEHKYNKTKQNTEKNGYQNDTR